MSDKAKDITLFESTGEIEPEIVTYIIMPDGFMIASNEENFHLYKYLKEILIEIKDLKKEATNVRK